MRIEIPKGTYKLVGSVAPSAEHPTPLMFSKFFDRNKLDHALRAAANIVGDWYLFQLAHHNPPPNNNLYWSLLPYGSYAKLAKVFVPAAKEQQAAEVFKELEASNEPEEETQTETT